MANIHMVREHGLGMAAARKVASGWARQVQDKLDMTCTSEVGKDGERISFTRTGVTGTLLVTQERFELDAKLGLMLGAFKGRIESEITKYLDELLAADPSAKASPAGKKGRTA